MTDVKEIWKTIPDFPKFEASNLGRIRRKADKFYPCLAKCVNGLRVDFRFDGKRYNRPVKKIIASLFLENEFNFKNIQHRDDDPFNCKASNLYFTNEQKRRGRGYGIVGEDSNWSKLSDENVAYILISEMGCTKLAKMFGVTHSAIIMIRKGIRWPHMQKLNRDELAALVNKRKTHENDFIKTEIEQKTVFTEKNVKQKIKIKAKENSKVPVRVDRRTIIFINRGENKKKAIAKYLKKKAS